MSNLKNIEGYKGPEGKERELIIPFLKHIITESPGGEWFNIRDLEEMLGFSVGFRLLGCLEGIIPSKKEGVREKGEIPQSSVLINKNSVWALPPFPKKNFAGNGHYCSLDLIDRINEIMGDNCLGKEKKDFEFLEAFPRTRQHHDAQYIRAHKDKGTAGIYEVCIPDILRLAICRNLCITSDSFRHGIMPLVLEQHKIENERRLDELITDENLLQKIWKNERTWMSFYKKERYYHPELFGGIQLFTKAIREYLKFDLIERSQKQEYRERVIKKELGGMPVTKPKHKKTGKEAVPINDDRLVKRLNSCVIYYNKSGLIPEEYYHMITTPEFNINSDDGTCVLIYGNRREFDGGAIDTFSFAGFKFFKLGAPHKNFAYIFVKLDESDTNLRGDSKEMDIPDPCLKEHMVDKRLVVLCESAYSRYNFSNFGRPDGYVGKVVLLETLAHTHGEHDNYKSPHKIREIEGAPKRVLSRFNAVEIPQFIMYNLTKGDAR